MSLGPFEAACIEIWTLSLLFLHISNYCKIPVWPQCCRLVGCLVSFLLLAVLLYGWVGVCLCSGCKQNNKRDNSIKKQKWLHKLWKSRKSDYKKTPSTVFEWVCHLDNVMDERVSEHPVQSDAVALHQVLEDKHTHTFHWNNASSSPKPPI